jgi:hypothetical protein
VLKALTLLASFLAAAPIAVLALALITGFRLTENWGPYASVTQWAFLVGTPPVAGIAAVLAHRGGRGGLFRLHLAFLALWAVILLLQLGQ